MSSFLPIQISSHFHFFFFFFIQVIKHCSSLYSFAKNCGKPTVPANHLVSILSPAQFQTLPHAQPTPSDLSEMSRLAFQVVHMLEEWKRCNLADLDRIKLDSAVPSDDSRPPKRPWEDTSGDGAQEPPETNPEVMRRTPTLAAN